MEKLYKFCRTFSVLFFIIVVFPVTGYAVIGLIDNIGNLFKHDKGVYSLVPVLAHILYLLFAFLSIRLLLKSEKYFSKLDVLEKLIESGNKNNQNTNTNNNELIKKYCDTLVDL